MILDSSRCVVGIRKQSQKKKWLCEHVFKVKAQENSIGVS